MPDPTGPAGSQTIPRPALTLPEDARFYEAAERYLDTSLRLNPTSATYYGYHRYDNLLDDFSTSGIASRVAFYSKSLTEFARFDRGAMSAGASIDLDLIRNDIEASLFSLQELKPHENDPTSYNEILGYSALFLTILEEGDPSWPDRLRSLMSRMKEIPRFLENARHNLGSPSAVLTDFTALQNPGNISFYKDTLPSLYERAPSLRSELEVENARVLAALTDYQRFLGQDLKARSRGDWRLGKELWTRKLRYTLQSDMEPEEIIDRAWKRLASERQAMLDLADPIHARMFPGHVHAEAGDERINVIVGEVIEKLSERHSNPNTLFQDVKERWIPRAKEFIRRSDFLTLPPESDNFVIERTPGFLDGLAVAFFNPPPAFEPHLKKSYWISSIPMTGDPEKDRIRAESYLREYNDYGLQSLTLHEALPGHYVQFYYALTSPYASIYKKIFANGTFAEGWAVLAEELAFQAGYAADEPETMLIHKKINLRTPINAILDARLHTEKLTDEEADRWALDLMRRYGFQEETEAMGKLRRAKVTATQLSTYFVGYLELTDLLEAWRSKERGAFSMKQFNERVLSYGTIPPRAIRRLMIEEA